MTKNKHGIVIEDSRGRWSYHPSEHASYLSVSKDNRVSETVPVTEKLIVDIGPDGNVIGIEILK